MAELPDVTQQALGNKTGNPSRRRVAAVVHEYWERSHADLMVTKLADGYQVMWVPARPRVDVVALHVGDPGPTDVGVSRARKRGIDVQPSIARTLRCGGNRLAVDGVVLIAERNERAGRPVPLDERGRPVDPRAEYFHEIADVCADEGRPVCVFIDKYLGRSWKTAKSVYDRAQDLRMPLMAGSSVPVTVRCPPTQLPLGARAEEAVVLATGIGEAPIFHPLELVQSMVERRHGYETGVARVEFIAGDAFWDAWETGARWSRELQEAALAAVPHVPGSARDFYGKRRAQAGQATRNRNGPSLPTGAEEAVIVEYCDGLRLSILLLTGYMLRRSVALRVRGERAPMVTWTPTGVKLTGEEMPGTARARPGQAKPPTWNFDHLTFFIDQFMDTGIPPYPVERTLLTTGVLDAAMSSRALGESVQTPHLEFAYQPRIL